MTAAKIMDITSRLPGLRWTSSRRSVSLYQVKMEDAHKLLKYQKSECPDIRIRLPRHKWPKSWSSMEDPVVALERNLYGHLLAGLLWERQIEKILLKHGWEKIPNWECLFVHRQKGLFLSVYVDDIKLAGKKQNIDPDVERTKQRSWFGRTNIIPWPCFIWVALKENAKTSKDIVDTCRAMSESRTPAARTEKLPCSENLCISSWSYDMEGHAKKCVER